MKKLILKLASVFCTVVMLSNGIAVQAEESEKIILPSGKPLSWVQHELEETDKANTEENPLFASAAVGIFQGDEVLYTGYFGETDKENQIPADENSVYEWGSISKTLIWVSAMQLWEQGKLDLEKDVREYLPEGFFQHLSYDEPITMLNLMNHNAGWQETTRPIWETDENKILPLREELQRIEPEQIHHPGEVTAYSNYGAAVAGYVIECVSGMDYCDYVHQHIFEPLGMEHTALNPAHSDNTFVYEQRKKMKSYSINTVYGIAIDLGNRLNYVPAYPAGAATGTLSDLMTYAQAFVNPAAPLFENPETQKILLSGTSFYGNSDIPSCCHGFWPEEYAVRTYGHNGATTSGQANMLFDPESGTGLVVMTNEPNGNWYLNYPQVFVFGALDAEKYTSGSPEKVKFDGYYVISRSTYRGMMKFIPYLSAISVESLGDTESIGNNVYAIRSEIEGWNQETAMLFSKKTYPDGNHGLEVSSMELIHDKFYLLKLCLFTIYVIIAIASVYLLRIRYKIKKAGRQSELTESSVMIAGQLARIVSFLTLLSVYVICMNCSGGIPLTAGKIISMIQIICMIICGISAILPYILNKNNKYNIPHTIGNLLCITAVLYFDMYRI